MDPEMDAQDGGDFDDAEVDDSLSAPETQKKVLSKFQQKRERIREWKQHKHDKEQRKTADERREEAQRKASLELMMMKDDEDEEKAKEAMQYHLKSLIKQQKQKEKQDIKKQSKKRDFASATVSVSSPSSLLVALIPRPPRLILQLCEMMIDSSHSSRIHASLSTLRAHSLSCFSVALYCFVLLSPFPCFLPSFLHFVARLSVSLSLYSALRTTRTRHAFSYFFECLFPCFRSILLLFSGLFPPLIIIRFRKTPGVEMLIEERHRRQFQASEQAAAAVKERKQLQARTTLSPSSSFSSSFLPSSPAFASQFVSSSAAFDPELSALVSSVSSVLVSLFGLSPSSHCLSLRDSCLSSATDQAKCSSAINKRPS